ncbi:MAG: protease inhibitor I42 family protein [Bacteroidota bacterium]
MKILLLFLLLNSCGSTKSPGVVENTSKAEDTIKIKVNENFEIKLGAIMGTGYRWILQDSAYQQLLNLDTTYTLSAKDIDGNPETQVFRFTGIKKGETIVKLVYIRPWKKQDPPDKEKKYTIIVQ